MDDDIWNTQFLEAISAAMDAMEEEEEEHVGRPATVLRGPRSCDGRIAKVCIYEG